jgi:hypothetical protein
MEIRIMIRRRRIPLGSVSPIPAHIYGDVLVRNSVGASTNVAVLVLVIRVVYAVQVDPSAVTKMKS